MLKFNMAVRPVFISTINEKLVDTELIEFKWIKGRDKQTKTRNSKNLIESFYNKYKYKPLEISTKSNSDLGISLSAFNLTTDTPIGNIPVECAYQGSKKYREIGLKKEFYNVNPLVIKKIIKEENIDKYILESFNFFGEIWNLEPREAFYSWLYIKALEENKLISNELLKFKAFIDIEFNPKKSINCQARACAMYVSLKKTNTIETALQNKKSFLSIFKNHQLDLFRNY